MVKKPETVKRALRQLRRECIDGQKDRALSRIAYAMEQAVRWATEDTVGWESLVKQARENASCLRSGL